MKRAPLLLWAFILCLSVSALGNDYERLLTVNEAAESWVATGGYPAYFTSTSEQFRIDGQMQFDLSSYGDDLTIKTSPNGRMAVLSSLQPLSTVKQSKRDGTFSVIDRYGLLEFQVVRSTAADLKPLVAAVSDDRFLALGDPVKGIIYIYQEGLLLSETQIYKSAPDYSMERKLIMSWNGSTLCILLERPNPIDDPDQRALLIFMESDGKNQTTYTLPFTHILDQVLAMNKFVVSGYNYDPSSKNMDPQIVQYDRQGRLLWSNSGFGHELALSSNGQYLAALASHELIYVIDFKTNHLERVNFEHNNKASLGLAVNDAGKVAVIRVALDYFVKQNTFFTEVFLPQTDSSFELQLNPRSRDLFQIHSNRNRFYIGTSYEWLEIR